MLANIVFQFFVKGGPVMWPLLLCSVAAVAVLESAPSGGGGKVRSEICKTGGGPRHAGKLGRRGCQEGGRGIKRPSHSHDLPQPEPRSHVLAGGASNGGRDRIGESGPISQYDGYPRDAAPLLGLLGTVTGLMRAFLKVGSAELSVSAVTGGIGEA